MDENGFRKWWKGSPKSLNYYLNLLRTLRGPSGTIGPDEFFDYDECKSLIEDITTRIEKAPTRKEARKISDLRSAIRAYVKFKKGLPYVTKKKGTYIPTRAKQITKIPYNKPINKLPRGFDKNGKIVWYDRKIETDNRIPGLVELVEAKYVEVFNFFQGFFEERKLSRIPIILSSDTPSKIYTNDDTTIAKKIKEAVDKNCGKISEKEILKWLKPVNIRTLGEYHPDGDERYLEGPYIVIFYNNFNVKDYKMLESIICMVVSHEFMHYCHHVIIGQSKFMNYREKAIKVKEAVADFAALIFLLVSQNSHNLNNKLATERYNFWTDHFGTSIPYAEALWFFHVDGAWAKFSDNYQVLLDQGCLDKFSEVIIESEVTDLETAYQNELVV